MLLALAVSLQFFHPIKVALLEQQYAELFDEVGRLDQEVKKNAQEILEAVRAEIAERQKAEKRLREQLEEAVVGHLELDLAGVCTSYSGLSALRPRRR